MELKRGIFHLIRYVPDVVRNEPINIGIIFYEADGETPKAAVRMTRDWSRLLFMCPSADIRYLEAMETEIAKMLKSRSEIDVAIAQFKRQWTSPLEVVDSNGEIESRGVLFSDFDLQVEQFMRMYIDRPPNVSNDQDRTRFPRVQR
jgi:hypothetical protein